jgi:aminocarboxymuconate-semialdehyde decarboxylase
MTRVIDIHSTFYPKDWLDFLVTRSKSPTVKQTGPTSYVLYVNGTIVAHIDVPGHFEAAARIKDMDAGGIDTQVFALSIPSVEMIGKKEGIAWARRINDYFAEVCQQYPERYYFHCTLPYQDPDAAAKELERSVTKLGAKGVQMFSNINFKPIASPEYHVIYELAEKLDVPVFVHPTMPFTGEMMDMHKLPATMYGYTLDTSTAIMSLIWQGVVEKYPKIKIVHSHLGGIVPYLVGRMNGSWDSFRNNFGLKLDRPPIEYYKSNVWIDTISYWEPAMKCGLELMGPDHIVLGTDYAHRIGNLKDAIAWVKKFGLDKANTDKILGGNSTKLYKLDFKTKSKA